MQIKLPHIPHIGPADADAAADHKDTAAEAAVAGSPQLQQALTQLLQGADLTRAQTLALWDEPVEALAAAADQVRRHFCGSAFALCAIASVKSGRCSENCRYCAQNALQQNKIPRHMMTAAEIKEVAARAAACGARRFSAVASGRAMGKKQLQTLCRALAAIHRDRPDLPLCASVGLIDAEGCQMLKEAGVQRLHCNLETSERFFPQLCRSHSFADKIRTIKAAQEAGLEICSGGIFGVGETRADRVDLALTLRELQVGSVPLNLFTPIAGTPMASATPMSAEEYLRTAAIFRLLLPRAFLRLAGGRLQLPDHGRRAMLGGINGMITGSMLTTGGPQPEDDLKLLQELNFIPCA